MIIFDFVRANIRPALLILNGLPLGAAGSYLIWEAWVFSYYAVGFLIYCWSAAACWRVATADTRW